MSTGTTANQKPGEGGKQGEKEIIYITGGESLDMSAYPSLATSADSSFYVDDEGYVHKLVGK